jgi:GNAT superfamily N-acetyltransferase
VRDAVFRGGRRIFDDGAIETASAARGCVEDRRARCSAKARLPVDDVEASGPLFRRFETADSIPVGFGGLEIHGEDGLLRSVVILPPLRGRGRGIGSALVAQLENEAALHGCRAVWLLTERRQVFSIGAATPNAIAP